MSNQPQFLVTDGVADGITFGIFDDEVSGSTSAMYIGRKVAIADCIEEPEALDFPWGLVSLPAPTGEHVGFHHLSVVSSELAVYVYLVTGPGSWVAADAACVHDVGLVKAVSDADVFGVIAVSQSDRDVKFFLESVVHGPPHDVHHCGVAEGRCTAFD